MKKFMLFSYQMCYSHAFKTRGRNFKSGKKENLSTVHLFLYVISELPFIQGAYAP